MEDTHKLSRSLERLTFCIQPEVYPTKEASSHRNSGLFHTNYLEVGV